MYVCKSSDKNCSISSACGMYTVPAVKRTMAVVSTIGRYVTSLLSFFAFLHNRRHRTVTAAVTQRRRMTVVCRALATSLPQKSRTSPSPWWIRLFREAWEAWGWSGSWFRIILAQSWLAVLFVGLIFLVFFLLLLLIGGWLIARAPQAEAFSNQ